MTKQSKRRSWIRKSGASVYGDGDGDGDGEGERERDERKLYGEGESDVVTGETKARI